MRFRVSGFRFWVAGAFGALVILLMLTSGCNMVWRRILPNPDKNQVVRVEKGERLYFDLQEDVDAGYRWESGGATGRGRRWTSHLRGRCWRRS